MPQVDFLPFDPKAHIALISQLLTSRELMYGWGIEPYTKLQVKEWVRESNRLPLLIQDHKTKKIVGMINFYEWNKIKKTAEWGVVIDPKFQGMGYATAAYKASVDYGFQKLNLKKITIYIEEHNKASRHIAEKVGYKFRKVNEKKQRVYNVLNRLKTK